MATPSHAQAVKSLNKSPGRRRFVFKTFSERVDEIDINVYRSLEKVKAEPSEGSSFFRDCLIEWRELNTAEDFISLYEEIMPCTQTLPLVLLQKESLISKLLSRLHMKARLSLEPILRLIAVLSRDLLEEFVPLLPIIVDSLVSLLESGGDKEPDIIEQIFTSWSYIMMFLQKYLIHNPSEVLKVTSKLRYYPKDYVQEFMAEAMSFVLRNAPDEQLRRGIRRVIADAVKKPSPCRQSGVEALLYNIMKGYSSRFHSKAERVLQLLTSETIYSIGDKAHQESTIILKIVKSVFKKLCEMMETKELNLVWNCLYKEVSECVGTGNIGHLQHILSVLVAAIKMQNGQKVSDYKPMLELVLLLVRTFIAPDGAIDSREDMYLVVDKILKLMLAILNGLCSYNKSLISECAIQWAPVFKSRSSSLLCFIRKLLQKDLCLLDFRSNIISAMNDLMEISEEEVIHLLQSFCEKIQLDIRKLDFLDGTSAEALARISSHLQGTICYWTRTINDIAYSDASSENEIDEGKLALLWGAVSCYSQMSIVEANPSLLVDLMDAADQLLTVKSGIIPDMSKRAWESIIGATLDSYNRLCGDSNHRADETGKFLSLAKRYKSSSQVLSGVASYLERKYGSSLEDAGCRMYHPELEERTADAVARFSDNLRHLNKEIRISTLKILCHYKPLGGENSSLEQPAEKKRKIEVAPTSYATCTGNSALLLLLSIETTPISITTSRSIQRLISKIQMDLSAGRISNVYVPLVLNGLFGILNNRFSYIWNPVLECIAVLISLNFLLVWDYLIDHLERCLAIFQTCNLPGSVNDALLDQPAGLLDCFKLFVHHASDSTPSVTILTSLLQALQKIPTVIEPRSRQFIPLFLKFLGYSTLDHVSVGLFDSDACKGREWKAILKEWLNLLKLMKNPKSFYSSQFLKEVLQNRLLEDNDPEIQMRVLDCLLIWKDDYFLPYTEHLRNLISSKNLREELTTWNLSRESGIIEECHRAYLVPLVILLLMPKVRKLKGLASRKKASICHRKAILSFIAGLDVAELPLFFALLIKPLQIVKKTDGSANLFWTSPGGSISEFQASSLLEYFTLENIETLSWKKKYGFLHVVEDIVGVFDELHIRPFLDLLLGCVVRVLESCTSSLDNAKVIELPSNKYYSSTNSNFGVDSVPANQITIGSTLKQLKDMRSLCLRIVSLVLNKYEDHEFDSDFWDRFFSSVKPLVDKFKQEAASSEKPSSLLSCFLAMSANHKLVGLLCRKESLVPDIFSIISVNSASEAVVYCVLKFVENLLSLGNQLDYEDSSAQRVLLSNIEVLMDSMCCLFGSDNAAKRKLIKSPGETIIRIFNGLPKYIKDAELAKQFVDILLLFLEKKPQISDVCVEVLRVIQNIIPILEHGSTAKILSAVSPLYILAELDMRLRICDLLDALVASDASVLSVAKLLRQLNATSTLGFLDHDAILNAYKIINSDFFRNVQVEHALLILSHCVHDMASEETTFMCSAHSSLLSFVDFSALILCQEGNSKEEFSVMKNTDDCWTKSCIQRITKKFLLKHMADAMDGSLSVRKGWIKLLHQMVLKLPEVSNLKSLMVLCNEGGEVNFFDDVADSVIRKRVKALSWFRNVISVNKLSEFITEKVFMRLFFCMMFDEKEGKAEHMKNACIETVASVAGQMGWKSYYALLIRCFRGVSSSPDKQKLFIRLICSILDKFHFSDVPYTKESKELDGVSDIGITDTNSSAILGKFGTSDVSTEIQTCLYKVVLPKIQKLLHSDSEKVNVNISLAALKLLKLLPGDVMDLYLPTILHRISNFLKSRLESIRDEARSALATCLKELGLEYLQFVVKVLQSTLKRGYELHVLGYTLNFILSKCLSSSAIGRIDYCLDDLLSVIEKDILGDVAEQKEVEKIAAKMKETRRKKSFDSLKLVAQNITFKSYALKLLAPVTAHLQKHVTPNVKGKLESMLHHIAYGIESNPSVDQTDLFIFIYGIIEDGLKDEIGWQENKLMKLEDKGSRFNAKRISTGQVVASGLLCSHLITVFGLRILHKRMKGMNQVVKDENTLSLLDPFVKLLSDSLSSKYEDILSSSLGCLSILVKLPLPSLQSEAEKVKAALLDIAQSSMNSSSPLMQSCLTLLTVLLRNTKISLTSDQIHLLIQLPIFLDLERNPSLVALSLLKGIVSRKLVVPEIYDLVTRVAELMVTSQMESIRKKCSKILLQFLLDYRLSEKRLQQHLDFLLSNLRYEHSTGRESVLEMIHAIIVKFPKSVLDEQSQTIFVHLVACLANDNDNIVRSMSGAAIKKLIGCVSPNSLNSVLEYALSWYLGGKQQLWGAAAQVLGLLIEVMKKGFHKHINCILPVTCCIFKSAIDAVTNRKVELSTESIIPVWKEAYYSLVMLEKMIHQFSDLCFSKDLEDIWEAICEMLLHPHSWIRSRSVRLIALYFAHVTDASRENHQSSSRSNKIMSPSRLFLIATSFCCQLKMPLINDADSNLMTQNIVFAICSIHSLMGQDSCIDPSTFWSSLEQHEKDQFLKAFDLLDSRKGRSIFMSSPPLTFSIDEDNGRPGVDKTQYVLVSLLLRKMGKIALQMDATQMEIVFNSFGNIMSQIRQDDCLHYARVVLLPLYKVCEGFAGKVVTDNLKKLAEDICAKIENILGTQNFVQVYNLIRKDLNLKRNKRKQEEKLMAVINPMRNAKRKSKIAAKHCANKKRKIMTIKMGRWMR